MFWCPAASSARADHADAAIHHVGGRQHVGAGFSLDERLLDERRIRLVVDDFVADEQAVVSVARVGIERDIENDA